MAIPEAYRITNGDRVHVDINCAHMTLVHDATVLHVPNATGDSWVFKDNNSERVYYVSEGCTITKI